MAIQTIVGSIVKYIDAGNQTIVRPKTVDSAVSVDRSGNSNVPQTVNSVRTLVDALGSLAFKSSIQNASQAVSGLMSASDKTKLDGIATGANKYTHPNSGVSAGTYKSVTVNAQGHITAGSNPTTLAGYGIIDAAPKVHQHNSDDITSIAASKISGVIDISHIPQGALERVIPVKDDTARKALTSSDVQKGDVVKVESTGQMYFVVDDTKLSTDAGYMQFTAGAATSVPWSGVTGKPSTFTPSSHTQAISTINGLQSALDGKAANKNMTGATTSAAGRAGLVPAPSTGAANRYLRSDGTWQVPPDTKTTLSSLGITATAAELNYMDGVTSNVQSQLNSKSASNHGHSIASTSAAGFLRQLDGSTSHYMRGDGTWGTPPNTTYSTFKAATASAAGGSGLVPAPAAGRQGQYLRGDGTWSTPPNTTYGVATTSGNGLMSAADKTKLDGIATGANKYVHPTTSGNKHIPSGGSAGQILRWGADGTAVWGADNNTTYTLSSFGITATAAELNYMDGVTSNVQTQLNAKMPVGGGTFTGRVIHSKGTSVQELAGGGGTNGYLYAYQIKIKGNYANQPIYFRVHQRSRWGEIWIQWNSVDSVDPTIASFVKTGNINAYIQKSATSTWNLYIKKQEAWDSIAIVQLGIGDYTNSQVTLTVKNTTVTSLPSGYTTASPYTNTMNISGNASTATTATRANTLTTARTINGTSFNGGANITTANWGTARTITIGKTGKSVNGSGNISWSLEEIGCQIIVGSSTPSYNCLWVKT